MNKHPFVAFVDLVSYDQQLIALEKEYEDGNQQIAQLERELHAFQEQQDSIHTRTRDAQKAVIHAEQLLREHQQMIDHLKHSIQQTSSSKEFSVYQARLKLLEHEYAALEDAVITAWQATEAAQKEELQSIDQLAKKKQEITTLIDQLTQRISDQKNLIEQKKRERALLLAPIAQEWLDSYEQLRGKIEKPIVPVESDACSYCYYVLPQPQLSALRRRALLQCKGCFRFLYMPSAYQEITLP